jgi:hypothetical protein
MAEPEEKHKSGGNSVENNKYAGKNQQTIEHTYSLCPILYPI